jgi:HK97 family phage major capsid protein
MNAVIQQRKSELASLAKDIQPLAEKSKGGTITAEEGARFDDLVAQFNAAGEALTEAQNRYDDALAVTQKIAGYGDLAASPDGVSRDTRGDPQGGPAARFQTLGQRFAESRELKQALKKSGPKPVMDEPFEIAEPLVVRGAGGLLQAISGMGPDEVRALIYSGTMSASTLLPQVYPTVYRGAEPPLVMRDVLLGLSTTSDNVTILQESGFTNNAAEVAEAIDTTTGAKPESALTFTEATFPVRIVAHWIPVTRQNLEDLAWIRGYVDGRLLQGLARREDNQFLNGNGTPPNLTGIYNTSGILVLDNTYFTGAPVTDAGQSNENLNRVRRAITRVSLSTVGGAVPSFIVANPADVEAWDTLSNAQREYLIGGPMAGSVSRLWGLPVVKSEYTAAKTVLVGDGSMAAVVDRSRSAIYTTDSHADFFVRNIFVILAEERVALVVFRPSAFAKVTLV